MDCGCLALDEQSLKSLDTKETWTAEEIDHRHGQRLRDESKSVRDFIQVSDIHRPHWTPREVVCVCLGALGHELVRWSRQGTSVWWRCLSVWVGAPLAFKTALDGNNHPCLWDHLRSRHRDTCAQGLIAGEAVGSHQHTQRSDRGQDFCGGAESRGALNWGQKFWTYEVVVHVGMMLMYLFSGLVT